MKSTPESRWYRSNRRRGTVIYLSINQTIIKQTGCGRCFFLNRRFCTINSTIAMSIQKQSAPSPIEIPEIGDLQNLHNKTHQSIDFPKESVNSRIHYPTSPDRPNSTFDCAQQMYSTDRTLYLTDNPMCTS